MACDHTIGKKKMHARLLVVGAVLTVCSCTRSAPHGPVAASRPAPSVIAVESFLADFTRQVAGGRVEVRSLVPPGTDARTWAPTAQDIRAAALSRLVITNGAGPESFMDRLMSASGEDTPVLEASHGLDARTEPDGRSDPCLWLNPVMAVRYVQNIRDALSRLDPAGELTFGPNADAYIHQLRDLDAWISDQVAAVPPDRRTLVTSEEGLGYFAERYGIQLVESKDSAAPGPFVEGSTYLEMMRTGVKAIVGSLSAGN
jgi:ABC-type Zn uptake system ZnuABC Zn-binding protein ZnuA